MSDLHHYSARYVKLQKGSDIAELPIDARVVINGLKAQGYVIIETPMSTEDTREMKPVNPTYDYFPEDDE